MKKLLEGFLFGFGFSAAAVLAMVVSMFAIPWDRAVADQTAAISNAAVTSAFGGGEIALIEHEKHVRGDDIVVIGRVKNEGAETARSFYIQVELFDAQGKLVDVFRESHYGGVPAGETRSFRVSSGACRSRPVPQHESYKVTVLTDV